MARLPYPLEALRKLRDERAEAIIQSLAAQIARCRGAEAKLREREQARREHETRTAGALLAERERFAERGANGADLLRLTEFEVGARAQAGVLAQSEAVARQARADEHAKEQKIREELVKLEAEAKLVRRHEANFHERETERQQKAEEEAALEQWSARRH